MDLLGGLDMGGGAPAQGMNDLFGGDNFGGNGGMPQ